MSRPEGRRRARRILFALALLAAPLVALVAAELVFRRLESAEPPSPVRVSTADVLGDAPWVSEHRKNVAGYYARYSPGPVIRYFPYAGWIMREFSSTTLNIDDDGVRRSIASSTPSTDIFRIYMFGGSTMVAADVPDDLTLPSQLARELGSVRGKSVEVVNFGSSAYSSTQELVRLLHDLQRRFARRGKPDLVIFYDGVNDVWAGVHLGRPGYPDAHDRIQQRFDDLGGFLRLKVRETLEARSALIRRLTRRLPEQKSLDHAALAREQAAIYAETIKATASWARDFGFAVLHVLQPVIFVQERAHEADAALRASLTSSDPALASANAEGYRALRTLFAATPGALDLSTSLDGSPDPLYIDYCHLGPSGNRLVAQRLAAAIK